MKKEYQDHIDDFLLGRMSDEEQRAFETEVKNDMELQEQLRFTEDVQHVMKSRNEKLSKMKEWENDYTRRNAINADSAMKHISGLRITYWFSGIAVLLIVGVFVFTTYKLPFRDAEERMMAEKPLYEKDYGKMLALLEKDEEDIKFKMMLLDRDKDTRGEKRENIEDMLKKLSDELQHLQWEKVQVLIGLKRYEEAMILLDEMRHSGSKYKEQADSLYHLLQQ